MRKKVFICSPYRGDKEANVKNAKRYCRKAIQAGCNPVAPHLYYPQFLDDHDFGERFWGLCLGLEILKECVEVWVYGEPTQGMQIEIEQAKAWGIPIIQKL